jgi:hypothetical protein
MPAGWDERADAGFINTDFFPGTPSTQNPDQLKIFMPAISEPKSRNAFYWLTAVALGAVAGYIDLIAEEVFITALLLLSCGMALGLWKPARGWLAGIALGAAIPAAHLLARATHFRVAYDASIAATFLALIPAVVGGAGGSFMRIALRHLRGEE